MQKWEYLVLIHAWNEERQDFFWNNDPTDPDKIERKLNKLGQEGWELIDTRAISLSSAYYHFKRPIQE